MLSDPKFKDKYHKAAFIEFTLRAKVFPTDVERKALFYLLSLFSDTRQHIDDLYDFEDRCIKISGLNKGWQTGGTLRATKLAFNLYNGYTEDDDCSPLHLFNVDAVHRPYLLQAVEIRFS